MGSVGRGGHGDPGACGGGGCRGCHGVRGGRLGCDGGSSCGGGKMRVVAAVAVVLVEDACTSAHQCQHLTHTN